MLLLAGYYYLRPRRCAYSTIEKHAYIRYNTLILDIELKHEKVLKQKYIGFMQIKSNLNHVILQEIMTIEE